MIISRLFPKTEDQYAYLVDDGVPFEDRKKIITGEKIDIFDQSKVLLKKKSKVVPDFLAIGTMIVLVSNRLKDFLLVHLNEKSLNFVSVDIQDEKYWLLNVIGLKDCMNYEKSTFTLHEGSTRPDEITDLVIHGNVLNEFDLFRLKENPILLFITNCLKHKIEESGFTGISFNDDMDLTKG